MTKITPLELEYVDYCLENGVVEALMTQISSLKDLKTYFKDKR